jgi:hypothetical protein
MVFLVARCFTRIYQSAPGGYARKEKEARSIVAAVAERKSW